ncbi:MAG TPA: hypothetical protein VJM50_09330 [Pyrinomonadaceae bacterium]|nr:hypothetical protein [Pyrinomonadaceae bacterium]
MTKLLVVCVGVILSLPVNQTFNLAERIGPLPRPYFRFETAVGKYTVRSDGFVEVYANNAFNHKRKRSFFLSMVGKGRLENIYFIEHEGDLFMRYDVIGQGSYLTRVEQRARTQKWVRALNTVSAEPPVIHGDRVLIDAMEIRKSDGKILGQG